MKLKDEEIKRLKDEIESIKAEASKLIEEVKAKKAVEDEEKKLGILKKHEDFLEIEAAKSRFVEEVINFREEAKNFLESLKTERTNLLKKEAELRAEIQNLTQNIIAKDDYINELNSKIAELNLSMLKMKKDYELKIEDLNSIVKKLEEELLEERNAKLSGLGEAGRKIEELLETKKTLEDIISNYRRDLRDRELTIKKLSSEIAELASYNEELARINDMQKKKFDEILKSYEERTEFEKKELYKKFETYRTTIESVVAELKNEVETLKDALEKEKEKYLVELKKLEGVEAENSVLRQEVSNLTTIYEELKKNTDKELALKQSKIDELEGFVLELRKSNEGLNSRINDFLVERDALLKEIEKLRNENSLLKEKISDTIDKKSILEKEKELLGEKFNIVNSELEKTRNKLLETINKYEEEKEGIIKNLNEKFSALLKAKEDEFSRKIEVLNETHSSELSALNEELKSKIKELSHTDSAKKALETELDELKNILIEREAQLKDLEMKNAYLTDEVKRLESACESEVKKLAELRNEYEKAKEENINLVNEISALKETNSELKKEIENILQSKQNLSDKHSKAIEELKNLDALKIELEGLKRELASTRHTLLSRTNEAERLKERIYEILTTNEMLEDENKKLRYEINETLKKYESETVKNRNLTNKIDDLKKLIEEEHEKRKSLAESIENLEKEINELKAVNEKMKRLYDEEKANSSKLAENLSQAKNEVAEFKKSNSLLTLEVHNLKNELANKEKEYIATLEELKAIKESYVRGVYIPKIFKKTTLVLMLAVGSVIAVLFTGYILNKISVIHYEEASMYYTKGDYENSALSMEKAMLYSLGLNGSYKRFYAVILGNLANRYIESGDWYSARDVLKKLLKLLPGDPEVEAKYEQVLKRIE